MGAVIGQLLPLGVGVAISPIPIIAVILMLLGPHPGGASAGFMTGWLAGIVVATVAFIAIAEAVGMEADDGPSTAASWTKLGLGVLLLLFAVRQWRGRPHPGDEPALPKWMAAIDSFTPAKALGLGFLLSALNPKNLTMCAAAGVAVAAGALSTVETVIVVIVFTLLAGCTVAGPVIAYAVASARLRKPLEELRVWLLHNNAAVMSVLLLVIGVVLVGKGMEGLG